MFSLTPEYDQLGLIEQIKQVNNLTGRNPVKFLQLLKEHIDLSALIPQSFYLAYYSSYTKKREYQLESLLAITFLIQFFKFANISNFITFLLFAPDVREFCRLPDGNVPDESVISKFKIKFESELKLLFENLSMKVISIFAEYDNSLPDNHPDKGLNEILIDDTSALKPKVKENNPKTLES